MPFPLLGPTTLFHLLIIVLGSLWRWVFPKRRSVAAASLPPRREIVCSAIIVFVFSGVATGASSILYVTAIESHSTINVVSAYFEEEPEISAQVPADRLALATTEQLSVCTTSDMETNLFDFLLAHELDISYEARRNYAFEHGVVGYRPTSEHNTVLLQNMAKVYCQTGS